MSENLRRYTTIVFGLEHVLRLVPAHAWSNRSPCDEWNARQVAGHAMGVVNNVAARGGVGTMVDVFSDLERLAGDDPAATFRPIRDRFLAATDRQGALQTLVSSRLGEMPLDDFIGQMCSDTLVHTWDIARATGVDDTLDPGAVSYVYADYLTRDQQIMREPGRYGAALDAEPAVNERDLMLAFSGRDPNWR